MQGRVAASDKPAASPDTVSPLPAIMRDHPVKTTLARGGRAFGAMLFEFFAPGIPRICRNAGADFVLYGDMPHAGRSFETLKAQPALCRGLDPPRTPA